MNAQAALKSYSNVRYNAGVQDASSHRLIQMLYDGVLERIAQAKGAMQQKNFEMKGKKVGEAISILLGLRDCLNGKQGGDIASNLDALYEYIQRALMEAHIKNNEEKLDECAELIGEISEAWRQIG